MEDRRNRTSEELATPETELRGFGFPRRSSRHKTSSEDLKAGPTIEIETDAKQYLPGDFLTCEYHVKPGEHQIQALETSVIWVTEGKGEEDIGVHFFERRQGSAINVDTFNLPLRLSTVLPASPLSYEGDILKIRWNVRVRLFLADGEQVTQDELFRLGHVEAFADLVKNIESDAEDAESEENAA